MRVLAVLGAHGVGWLFRLIENELLCFVFVKLCAVGGAKLRFHATAITVEIPRYEPIRPISIRFT